VTEQSTFLDLSIIAAHWLSLWLGLYLLSRRPSSGAGALVGCACLTLSAYLLATASTLAPGPLPGRALWGAALGGWVALSPALLLHAFLKLTDSRLSHQRLLLIVAYTAAAVVCVLSFSTWRVFAWDTASTAGDAPLAVGPLYPLILVQLPGTAALALFVLVHARLRPSPAARRVLPLVDQLVAGMALLFIACVLMQTNVYFSGNAWMETLYYPVLLIGSILVVRAFARYPGLIEGQLLRTDLRSSLLGAVLLLAVFAMLVLAAGGGFRLLAGLGWLVLVLYVYADDIRALMDRAFYGAGSRAARSGLRRTAAYVGTEGTLDVSALTSEQARNVADYMEQLDRASVAATRFGDTSTARLALLGRDEFGAVRTALGLPSDWAPGDGLDPESVSRHVLASLEPRERQALGLRYLGYSDKEMARPMGIKVGVPRSYLAEGKRKLGLTAGASVMLFVHFARLVDRDALPLITAAPAHADAVAAPDAEVAASPGAAGE